MLGYYSANAWGLLDLHGNVADWTLDWYGEYPMGDVVDPTGPSTGTSRVIRGGSWNCPPALARSANRNADVPSLNYNGVGVRPVLTFEAR